MSEQIRAGVLLSLRDQYSQDLRKPAAATQAFTSGILSGMDKINKATNTVAGKLAGLGLGFGAGAAVNQIINYQARLTRLATAADMSDGQLAKLKDQIYAVSSAPQIKVDPSELTGAIEEILQRTGDLEFAQGNIKALGAAIQATGASGGQIGGWPAEFNKVGFSTKDLMGTFDVLNKQGKSGAFTFEDFSALGPRLISSYGAARQVTADTAKELGATMQIIRMGAGSADQAATSFEAAMRNFSDPQKQKQLRAMGIAVRDSAGQFRPVSAIMQDIVVKGKQMGNLDKFGAVLDSEAMRTINAFSLYGDKFDALATITGDGSSIMADAARNANTLKAGLGNVQTAFTKFADKNLTAPLGVLTDLLNHLAEKPHELERVFTTVAVGLGAIAAVKGITTVTTMLKNIKDLKAPKLGTSAGGGSGTAGAMPVMVTNWPAGGSRGRRDSRQRPWCSGFPRGALGREVQT